MTWIFCENRWILTDNFCLRVSTTRVTGTSSKMIDKKFIHWNILKSNFRWHICLKLGNSLQLQLIDNFLNLFYSSILAGLAFNSAGYLISPVFTLLSIWPNPVTASLSHQARTRGTRNPPSVTTGFSWIHYIVAAIWDKIIFYNSR